MPRLVDAVLPQACDFSQCGLDPVLFPQVAAHADAVALQDLADRSAKFEEPGLCDPSSLIVMSWNEVEAYHAYCEAGFAPP